MRSTRPERIHIFWERYCVPLLYSPHFPFDTEEASNLIDVVVHLLVDSLCDALPQTVGPQSSDPAGDLSSLSFIAFHALRTHVPRESLYGTAPKRTSPVSCVCLDRQISLPVLLPKLGR